MINKAWNQLEIQYKQFFIVQNYEWHLKHTELIMFKSDQINICSEIKVPDTAIERYSR